MPAGYGMEGTMRTLYPILIALFSSMVQADDRADYNRRAAAADTAAFRQLDLNRDGNLSREEAGGDLDLGPRFNDMDVNRDGLVTPDELRRYLEQTYGASPS
jgi:Ca2+-binding EF-hand superfamily protein